MQRVLAAVRRRFPRFFRVAVFRVLAAVRLASSARAVHDQSIRETRDEQVPTIFVHDTPHHGVCHWCVSALTGAVVQLF